MQIQGKRIAILVEDLYEDLAKAPVLSSAR
jgi:hypothetical protein